MLYISTNMFNENDFTNVYEYVDDEVGIEIFPYLNKPFYEWILVKEMGILKNIPTSFHGPYYGIEHSEKKGTVQYEYSMMQMKKCLQLAESLGSKYVVYHHNNKPIDNPEIMLFHARENLYEINELSKIHHVPVVVENAGIKAKHNMLFEEEDFIRECKRIPNQVLVDIGHANCNGWNLDRVIKELAYKICAYHIHNNDGTGDLHNRIYQGSLDFRHFLELALYYTPHADMTLEYSQLIAYDVTGIKDDIAAMKCYWLDKIKTNCAVLDRV